MSQYNREEERGWVVLFGAKAGPELYRKWLEAGGDKLGKESECEYSQIEETQAEAM